MPILAQTTGLGSYRLQALNHITGDWIIEGAIVALPSVCHVYDVAAQPLFALPDRALCDRLLTTAGVTSSYGFSSSRIAGCQRRRLNLGSSSRCTSAPEKALLPASEARPLWSRSQRWQRQSSASGPRPSPLGPASSLGCDATTSRRALRS
jgi:hypothetical protein